MPRDANEVMQEAETRPTDPLQHHAENFWRRAFSSYALVMPELCPFFGIIIRMYMELGQPHNVPHFHAYYQGDAAVFSLEPIELIAGALPRRQSRLVEAWAELHAVELLANWHRLQRGQLPLRIAPLL